MRLGRHPSVTRAAQRLLLIAATLCGLGCASSAPSGQTDSSSQPQIGLYAMDCGRFFMKDADAYADDGSFKGISRNMVDPCYLIRHPRGDLMWDLGVPDGLALTQGEIKSGLLTMRMPKSLASQLHELNVAPEDIDFISISHSHIDHIGNGRLFKRATLLIDARERAFMSDTEVRESVLRKAVAQAQEMSETYTVLDHLKTIEIPSTEVYDVFSDGSVVIYPAPGHTPGHRVLLLRLPHAGSILLTGDLYHLAESRARRTVPRLNNRAQTLASMDMVEKLAADLRARVIRQHVAEDFYSLPPFPEPLH
jgi:N-acyl homoserine lactone hydrolase